MENYQTRLIFSKMAGKLRGKAMNS
jgi:hypothetical protein